jgi:hypothetical protein
VLITSDDRMRNFAFLQAVADSVGRDLEARSYDELQKPSGELSFQQVIDGTEVNVSVQAKRREADGTLTVRVDVQANLPTPLGAPPEYVFRKRPDGSVY